MTTRYKIRQNLISIGDDFWIENEEGRRVYKVDGKVLRIRKTLVFEDANGGKLAQIQERLLTIKDTMIVEDADGNDLATIKKALITPLRDRWDVKVKNGPDLEVQGDFLAHEYTINAGREQVAEVSKKWLTIADTYGVQIEAGQNHILILAIAVAIDIMTDADAKKKKEKKNKLDKK